jgi:hypothetical protein
MAGGIAEWKNSVISARMTYLRLDGRLHHNAFQGRRVLTHDVPGETGSGSLSEIC